MEKLLPQTKLLLRYTLSGAVAAAVHFGILATLVEFLNFNPTLASAIGFIAAIFVNYSLQYHWTFAVKGTGLHRVLFSRYLIVTFFTFGLNTLLFWYINEVIGLQYLVSQVIVTGVLLLVNFVLNQYYTFSEHRCSMSS